jgi:hypothetical protein
MEPTLMPEVDTEMARLESGPWIESTKVVEFPALSGV